MKGEKKISIKSIVVLEKKIIDFETQNQEKFEFLFDISLVYAIVENTNIFETTLMVDIKKSTSENEVIGHIKIKFSFIAEEIIKSIIKDKQNSKSELPKINEIVIPTARGIMHENFRGSKLHDAILPIFDISKMNSEIN